MICKNVSSRTRLLCFDLEHLSACSLSSATISLNLKGEPREILIQGGFAASPGLTVPADHS